MELLVYNFEFLFLIQDHSKRIIEKRGFVISKAKTIRQKPIRMYDMLGIRTYYAINTKLVKSMSTIEVMNVKQRYNFNQTE